MTHDEARQALKDLGWPNFMINIGIRARFCCEYCGKDLLSSVNAYDSWQKDHIDPNGGDCESNLAVSCKTCNFIKRGTNPAAELDKTDRESLVWAAKAIIDERRERKQHLLNKTVEAANVLKGESSVTSGI